MNTSGSEPITDIIFDLGKVLVPFDWDIALEKLFPLASNEIGEFIRKDPAGFMKMLEEPANRMERGSLDFANFFAIVSNVIGFKIPMDKFREIWCDIFWVNHNVINIGMTLAQRYSCWLMSNTSRAHYEWIISKFPEIMFYKKAALSYEIGHMKPEPEYYIKGLQLFGVNPHNVVFIDDIQENLDGAATLGIRTIRFEGAGSLIERLKDYGVSL